ncbi:MAG TPA: hypothetical protein VG222_04015 [Vicinamibacterales bacterium]|jgi:hypothetical protein|nr:hypothetical protein [Vicinamibacterales bacterium]
MKALLTFVPSRLRRAVLPLVAGCSLLVLSGCTRAHAKVAPDQPALAMPEPPPRDVEPIDAEMPAPMPLPGEPAHTTPSRTRPPQRTEPAKPEPKADTPKIDAPAEAPKPEEPAHPQTPPPTTLQTMPAAAEGEMERTIRATLSRATTDLNRVDYRGLNKDARNQYDLAKGYAQKVEDLIRAKNLLFAKTLADKAADLAAQLAGR